ncbi:hypothetical protein HanXRQr2_Chr02g0071371 [Helianthus annuus]|uniref:Uncharacterized protein n=1 Tax=Helianthus annuus TaxID=4232 RepID=A0A9K3JPH6_HELAN|nr:uncharacterized protein LOC110920195 isoform X1 [Helianthus annuus]XP_022020118.1 uncharacterized protein LOC110920195 isoform X1 [Helianthus annuus]XP_022020133.1 uncharacterized protein LOC110920195 isoform X1 [Helianthus annuus]KAF5818896.1 hypothetical protein HanXRQr2_Chr02g0071371 [Helianthus annuus]KAJ0605116.1 hypothetical protein HanHA300_Chr02g0059351 [Helianthus annuus]KAJ0619136.1 hypothetical protein HanHA89_Chr02g0067921 [Helianthus annuus]KAJ0777585.1 hypothetical protein Ha
MMLEDRDYERNNNDSGLSEPEPQRPDVNVVNWLRRRKKLLRCLKPAKAAGGKQKNKAPKKEKAPPPSSKPAKSTGGNQKKKNIHSANALSNAIREHLYVINAILNRQLFDVYKKNYHFVKTAIGRVTADLIQLRVPTAVRP